jgi:MFS family permease
MAKNNKKLGFKNWAFIWLLGMAGQLCWNIENYWFNTFVYKEISPNPTILTVMVAVSAAATTIATFVMGTLSDRMGKRKPFIGWGYILWGIFTIVFGLSELVENVVLVAAIMVVVADAIMSFFGSIGNDAGFNAWTTDLLTDDNKGQIGAAIAAHPVLATIIGTVVGGIIIDQFNYLTFFTVMGLLVIVMGIMSLLFLNDSPTLQPKKTHPTFIKQFFSVFDFNSLVKNKELFYVFMAMSVFFIGFNVYFVHIGNYFIHNLGFDEGMAGVIQGGCLGVAILATIPAAIFINKGKHFKIASFAIVIDIVGLIILYFAKSSTMFLLLLGVVLAGIGYVLISQTLTIWVKRLYPEDNRGQFEGVRIVFFVLIPMIMGPVIANPIIKYFGKPIIVAGKEGMAPTSILFVVAAVIALISLIPIYYANKCKKD